MWSNDNITYHPLTQVYHSSNDMDCGPRGIRAVRMRLFQRSRAEVDGISINSFSVSCVKDDQEYQKNHALAFLPEIPETPTFAGESQHNYYRTALMLI